MSDRKIEVVTKYPEPEFTAYQRKQETLAKWHAMVDDGLGDLILEVLRNQADEVNELRVYALILSVKSIGKFLRKHGMDYAVNT